LHTFLRHPLHIFSSGGPPPARTHPGPIRSRAKPAPRGYCCRILHRLFSPGGYPYTSPAPPPRPRLRRSSPAPTGGAGSVRGDTWWKAVSGVEPAGSRDRFFAGLSPCSGPWWISPSGERLTGRGGASPLPCLQIPILRFVGIPHSAGSLHPTRAFVGIPVHSLPAAPTPPAPPALLPRPLPAGGGSARDTWWKAVPGVEPVGSRALDRGDIAFGGGADGEGELVPPPLSLTLQTPCSLPAPSRPAFSRQATHTLLPAPPPRPRLRRSAPSPAGRGQCVAISGEQPYPGCNRWATVPGSSPGSPHMLDRGDIAIGGGGPRGGGTCSPSPVSHAPDTLLLASPIPPGLQPAGYPCTSAGSPHPARAFGAPPPPRRGGGSAWRYQGSSRIRGATGGPPCPALLQDLPMLWTVGISPLGEAARGAGELVPPPLSLTLQIPCSLPALSRPAFSRQATHTLRRHPHPFLHRDL